MTRLPEKWALTRLKRSRLFPYVCAIVMPSCATVLRIPFAGVLGEASPFLFYWPTVLTVAVCFGLRPGLVATTTAAILANYFWMPPHVSLGLTKVEFLQVLTFVFGSGSLAWLSEWLHHERQSKEHYRATLTNAGQAIVTADRCGRIRYLNPAAQMLSEVTSEEAIGQPIGAVLALLNSPDRLPIENSIQRALLAEEPQPMPTELILVSRGGKEHRVKATFSRMLDNRGDQTGCIIVLHRDQSHGENKAVGLSAQAPA